MGVASCVLALTACCAVPACAPPGNASAPTGADGAPLLYRQSVVSTPCPPTGCASEATVLTSLGLLTIDDSSSPERVVKLSSAKMEALRTAIRGRASSFFARRTSRPTPEPNDVVGSCEVWLDGRHGSYRFDEEPCRLLEQWIDQAETPAPR